MKTMKTLVLLFVLLVPLSAFTQDTISTHITSSCLSFSGSPPEYHFSRTADSITIYGKIGANCASSHIAIIQRTPDAILITTKDTGLLATCWCDFNFRIQIKVTSKDTLVIINGSLMNLNQIFQGIDVLNDRSELIDVIFDPDIESLRIGIRSGVQIRMFTIFDGSGRQILSISNDRSLIDMSGFESGLYLLDFRLSDNSHIIKKVIKK